MPSWLVSGSTSFTLNNEHLKLDWCEKCPISSELFILIPKPSSFLPEDGGDALDQDHLVAVGAEW